MKRSRIFSLVMAVLMLMCLSFTACNSGDTHTYKVWTGTFNFSSSGLFGTLQDGYFSRVELTKTQFDSYKSNSFQNRPENVWTEDQVYTYLIGLGFGNTVAKTQTEWLISIDHGIIGIRKGPLLYTLLK